MGSRISAFKSWLMLGGSLSFYGVAALTYGTLFYRRSRNHAMDLARGTSIGGKHAGCTDPSDQHASAYLLSLTPYWSPVGHNKVFYNEDNTTPLPWYQVAARFWKRVLGLLLAAPGAILFFPLALFLGLIGGVETPNKHGPLMLRVFGYNTQRSFLKGLFVGLGMVLALAVAGAFL
ncbi:MAG: hypothetical protein V4490_01670, partial [Pseudomonadota bacterium]